MPKWGLTEEMRASEPYGLAAHMLVPAKVITDPVHRDIRLTELERRVVDSPSFQRLRRVRQLGTTHLVYPSATHSRFSHSLGAVQAAQLLLDVVLEQRSGLNPKQDDLFGEWLDEDALDRQQHGENARPRYLRRVAEMIVLTRLGALLHDFCHIPFGHTVEDELGLLTPHDANRDRFECLWQGIDETVRDAIISGTSLEGRTLYDDVLPIILSKLDRGEAKRPEPPAVEEQDQDPGAADISYPFAQDIVGNTISADLLDYLTRDHAFTGLPAALGHRFLDGFYVSRSDAWKPRRMVLKIVKRRRERQDTITELLKYLRYRYELSERALAHHAKLAADAMVGKLLGLYYDRLLRDNIEKRAVRNRALRERLESLPRDDVAGFVGAVTAVIGRPSLDELRGRANATLEAVMLEHGDDGLFERIRAETAKEPDDPLAEAIAELVDDILARRLYRSVAHLDDQTHAERLWEQFGEDPIRRRGIERDVARYAEILAPWRLALWISPTRMRLKPALVLVDDDEHVTTLLARERSRDSKRGVEIYDAHRRLWSVEVFAHRGLMGEEIPWVQARFAEALGIGAWSDTDAPVKAITVARDEVGDHMRLTRMERMRLEKSVPAFLEGTDEPGGPTRSAAVDQLEQAALSRGLATHVAPVSDDQLDRDASHDDQQQELGL